MTTLVQQPLIDSITRALSADARIESAWLTGSLGKGGGDEFSDVDVTVVVPEAAFDETLHAYNADVSAIAPTVHLYAHLGNRVVSAITPDWRRFDLTFVKPAEFAVMPLGAATALFNRGTPERPAPKPAPPYKPKPETIEKTVREFLRVLGLASLGVGRREYMVMFDGIGLLRRMTIDLMLERNGIAPSARGGALHLNTLLTAQQRAALEALPPLAATRDSALASNMALARLFLPLARELAAQTGAAWPTAFEEATRRHLARTLGLEI